MLRDSNFCLDIVNLECLILISNVYTLVLDPFDPLVKVIQFCISVLLSRLKNIDSFNKPCRYNLDTDR